MINGNFVSIVGGAGHVGAPLGLALSSKGYNVILIDKNKENTKKINRGEMPFIEKGCAKLLKETFFLFLGLYNLKKNWKMAVFQDQDNRLIF